MDYANDLQDECEELDITDDITRGHISPANVNAEKCDKLKHCTAMLTTSVLTDQNKVRSSTSDCRSTSLDLVLRRSFGSFFPLY